jgi:actin related protein 2/3 complex subunit 1A/1B
MSLKRLAGTITCHAWNADGSMLALCPNNNEVHIYKKAGAEFNLEHVLTEHDQVVTGIDWAPKSNRLVTCSQDRNAYVWTWKDNQWKPMLVILRINRAATDVKWSPDENKFAVASGAKLVSICYFEEDNDWWVSKHIKKHKSTVTKVDWHPSSVLIATSSSDMKTRVFGAFIKGVDKGAPDTPFGNKLAFGDLLAEIDNASGWVHSVKWSPSGNKLAFVAHDSSLYVADVAGGNPKVDTVPVKELPFRDLIWASEDSIVAAGFDCAPFLFQNKGGWQMVKTLDTGGAAPAQGAAGPSAIKMFQNQVNKGESSTATSLNTKHQNAINRLQVIKRAGANVTQYSTSGTDGNIGVWEAPK